MLVTFSMSSLLRHAPTILPQLSLKSASKAVFQDVQIDEGRGISGATLHTPEHTIANHQLWFLNSRTKDYSISQCVVL